MTTTDRRRFIGASMLAGAAIVANRDAQAKPGELDFKSLKKDTDIACAYHCDFGDKQRYSQMLTNINNHLSVYDFDPFKLKIVIVTHGGGVKFFLNDYAGTPWEKETIDEELYKRFVALTKFGVEAYMCKITFQRLKIDMEKTRQDAFLKFVPSGVATVAELQTKGYAYVKCL